MILFLYGPDAYRSKEKLEEIVAHYKEVRKSGLNLSYLDAKDVSFGEFYNTLKMSSMFAETKLVILKNTFGSKPFQESFLGELKNIESLKDVVVIYEADEVDQRLKLFKTLTKDCKCQEFAPLDAKQVKMWAQARLQTLGAAINNDALDLLVSFVGNNLFQLSGELGKLANYRPGSPIKKSDVELLVAPNLSVDIFKTIDALAQKDKKQALGLLYKHLEGDENPLYLLSMIGYQIRNLLVVKELSEQGLMYASIVKKSGLHPFVVKKSYFLCRSFTFEELKGMYHRIFAMDSDIKTGNIEAETALDVFVAKL
ncbi:DNA polymerase III subunit delta [Candidatus Parcubacteria bacterium]|nr:DNA polymerase III subunit delta [Candidatus Parcubacteria bacterium]